MSALRADTAVRCRSPDALSRLSARLGEASGRPLGAPTTQGGSGASRSAASVEVVALLRKPDAVKVPVPVRYVGFDIPSEFVVGYGLDYSERYRDLPYIGTLKPEVYQ